MKQFFCLIFVLCVLGSGAQTRQELYHDAQYFSDLSYTQLAKGVKAAQVKKIKNNLLRTAAEQLLQGRYDTTYRAVSYGAYPSPAALQQAIRLGDGFSRYENPTGMFLPAGENIVLVGPTGGKEIALMAPDLMRQPAAGVKPTEDPLGWGLLGQEFPLQEGVNVINLKKASNVYLSYYDEQAHTAPRIKVHFLTGAVNGVFDPAKMDNAAWDSLLNNAVSPIVDAVGRFIQVAYPVEWFKKYAMGKGRELVAAYDTMLYLQYELMGLVKYNKLPKNHLFARVNFNYYMFRDRDGVAYLGDERTMGMVVDPARVRQGDPCWGFSHEVGHVLQMRPQMTWGGLTEVSNNIFSLNNLAVLDPGPSRIKRQDNYNKARAAIIDKGISYLEESDPFNRLVPFWQLQLYFAGQKGLKDLYPDVMEALRNRPVAGPSKKESIKNQFDFIQVVCDVTKTDLTDFFDKWGFFKVGTIELDDYGKYTHIITPEMVAETKAYIASKNYPKPEVDVTLTTE